MPKDKTTFVVIQDWMFRLGLDLTETVIFAIIYGFSQDGETRFRGSWKYLEEHALCSRAKVARTLKRLVELNYVCKCDKFVNGIKFCEYYAEIGSGSGFAYGITERPPVSNRDKVVSMGDEGSVSVRHNNKEGNKNDNKADNAHTRVAKNISNRFSFRNALIVAGASEPCVDKLMEIRKRKRLNNSENASRKLIAAITTICNTRGVTVDDVLRFMNSQDWGAIRPDWGGVENIRSSVPRGGKMLSFEELMNRDRNRYASQ